MRPLLILLLLALAACGGGSAPAPPPDVTPPLVSLVGDDPQLIEAGTPYLELGATASDNLDGDLTNSIVIDASAVDTSVPGDYMVNYQVRDAAGNTGTASRIVTVQDTTPPDILLLGDNPQAILAGDPYVELSVTAIDSVDGDVTQMVVVDTGQIDLSKSGNYTVVYKVADSSGNQAVLHRDIRVLMTGTWKHIEMPPRPAPFGVGSSCPVDDHMYRPTSVLLPSGRVLVGGESLWTYDPNSGTFELITNLDRKGHTSTLLLDGRVLITGGGCKSGSGESFVFDPVTTTLSATGMMSNSRSGHSATLLSDGRVLLVGGTGILPNEQQPSFLNSAEIFDPVTNAYSATDGLHYARSGHTATALDDRYILIAGGYNAASSPPTMELFDSSVGVFSESAVMPDDGRWGHSTSLLPNGKILFVGGWPGPGIAYESDYQASIAYDRQADSFEVVNGPNELRGQSATVSMHSTPDCPGPVVVAGGYQGWKWSNEQVDIYDPILNRFYATNRLDRKRANPSAVALQDGRIFLLGGWDPESGGYWWHAEMFEPIGACN
jgi:hypothetical protein